MLTNDVVGFEQPGSVVYMYIKYLSYDSIVFSVSSSCSRNTMSLKVAM